MKLFLWNIDAMGWFEPVSHILEYGKLLQASGNVFIRPNLDKSIENLTKLGYEVVAVTSKTEDYAKECMRLMNLELKLVCNLQENALSTDYSPAIKDYAGNAAVAGSRPKHQPISCFELFIHHHKPYKKDAMIEYKIIQKLEEEGGLFNGFSRLFLGNAANSEYWNGTILVKDVNFNEMKLDLEQRLTISTVMVDENA